MRKSRLFAVAMLLFFSFLALNIAAFLFGSSQIFDLTPDNRYTLSDTTKNWLAQNTKNIYIRFYQSPELRNINPDLPPYAPEVLKVLEQYQINSHHKLGLQIVDTAPFSLQENEAQRLGIKELKNTETGQKGYFGLVISDEEGNMRALPYLNPARRNYLEQDISRLLSNLESAKKTDVGILSPTFKIIPSDDAWDLSAPWPIADVLSRDYDLTYVPTNTGQIPLHVDILLVVNPLLLPNLTLYAIDQFMMYGGKVIILMDGMSEYMLGEQMTLSGRIEFSDLFKFLRHYGVNFVPDTVIGDEDNARLADIDGQKERHPFWLRLYRNMFADHPIMRGVSSVTVNSAGKLELNSVEGLDTTILLGSGVKGVEAQNLELSHNKTGKNMQSFRQSNQTYPLAVLQEGKFNSFFLEPYADVINGVPYLSLSLEKSALIVMADSDLLLSSTWNSNIAPEQEWYDVIPEAGNIDFLTNAIDYLSANPQYLSVAPKINPYPTASLVEIFSYQARLLWQEARTKVAAALAKTEAEILDINRKISSNAVVPSLLVTRQIDALTREKINLQQEQQKIEYQTVRQYHKIIYAFLAGCLGLSLAFVAFIGLAHWLFHRHSCRKIEEYINE